MRTRLAVPVAVLLASLGGCGSSGDGGGEQPADGAFDDPSESSTPPGPAVPAEPVGAAQPIEPVESDEPIEASGPVEAADPFEPVEATQPAQPAQPVESSTPPESTEPTGSSEPAESSGAAEPIEPVESADSSEPVDSSDPVESTESPGPAEPLDSVDPAEPSESVEPSDSAEPTESAEPSNPVDPSNANPQAPPSTRVDIEITVPAHVSNALTVGLTWGTKRVMAEWIGDEQWRATIAFPRSTFPRAGFPENRYLLAIDFRDRNGDILLGRGEAFYSVREGDAEIYTVVADDFDTERWDDDSDGVSNLDELRRGTDPLVADTPLPPESLEVLDSLFITQELEDGATYFEPRFLALELPVDDRTDVVDEGGSTTTTTITEADFSADGNGVFRERYSFEIVFDRDAYSERRGTRTREGSSVTWSGVRWTEGSSLAVRTETTFDITSTLDGDELSQRGEGFVTSDAFGGSRLDFVSYRYDVVLDLDSRDADDRCEASRGRVLSVIKYQGDQGTVPVDSTRVVSRDSADERWTWSGVDGGTRVAGEANRIANRFYCGFRFEP